MNPNRFEYIGKFEGIYYIVTDPMLHAPRRLPISMICEIKKELDQVERRGVIEQVKEPTGCDSSLVYARKQSGKL